MSCLRSLVAAQNRRLFALPITPNMLSCSTHVRLLIPASAAQRYRRLRSLLLATGGRAVSIVARQARFERSDVEVARENATRTERSRRSRPLCSAVQSCWCQWLLWTPSVATSSVARATVWCTGQWNLSGNECLRGRGECAGTTCCCGCCSPVCVLSGCCSADLACPNRIHPVLQCHPLRRQPGHVKLCRTAFATMDGRHSAVAMCVPGVCVYRRPL